MDSKKFIKDYQSFLRENADPKRARKEKKYLYSNLKHYGGAFLDSLIIPFMPVIINKDKKAYTYLCKRKLSSKEQAATKLKTN